MKKTSYTCFVFLCLFLIGCKQTIVKEKTHPFGHKWQPISLKDGEFFQYLTSSAEKKPTLTSLLIRQDKQNKLQASWTVHQDEKIIVSKQVIASSQNVLTSSKAALMTEKHTGPFLNTILMHWWPGIDYFRWEIGFKRAVLVEMLAGFMVEVIKECNVAGIQGFQVRLTTGKILMAEACLSPTIAFPLSVKRYHFKEKNLMYEATLLNYRYQ